MVSSGLAAFAFVAGYQFITLVVRHILRLVQSLSDGPHLVVLVFIHANLHVRKD